MAEAAAGRLMPDVVYSSQIVEPSRVGFRNGAAEPWLWYSMPKDQQGVISIAKSGDGYAPQDDWALIGDTSPDA